MANLWPWLAVAALGAWHGLNPASGWMLAAASGLHARDRAQAWRAMVPIAAGHLASVALVAMMVALGGAMDRLPLQLLAGALLCALAVHRLRRHRAATTPSRHGAFAMALWSFIVSTAHGAGLMLVPALVPLCLGDSPAREITASGSLILALAAIGVHTAAMLAVIGLIAVGLCSASNRWVGTLR